MPRHNGGLDNCANARIVGEGQTMIYITQSCSVSVVTLCCKDDSKLNNVIMNSNK